MLFANVMLGFKEETVLRRGRVWNTRSVFNFRENQRPTLGSHVSFDGRRGRREDWRLTYIENLCIVLL